MSDLEGLSVRLDHLAEAVDSALAARDIKAYRIARIAYGAALDQLEARVAAGATKDAQRGIRAIEAFLREY